MCVTSLVCVNRWGRRKSIIGYHILTGVTLLVVPFIPSVTGEKRRSLASTNNENVIYHIFNEKNRKTLGLVYSK